jgi:hypothetical protein
MSGFRRAEFQEAAVRHIVGRLRAENGSRRMLLADEVGLGKTIVARGVIEAMLERRRKPLTVIYLCSNAEIAEQNRTKLDPQSPRPFGRVTELALKRGDQHRQLHLYSFTPGTSLKEGTGLAWERRLVLYLLHRIYGFRVWTQDWREFFRCGAGPDKWHDAASRERLFEEFERKTGAGFQAELAAAWRNASVDEERLIDALCRLVPRFRTADEDDRHERNRVVAQLRSVAQRVALSHLDPDLVILDEVQRFREVLEQAENPQHIAAELFARRVPVLILSATPYRALTLGHEVADGTPIHHEDFFSTLKFLFDRDRETPLRIQQSLEEFGRRLKAADHRERLDPDIVRLKRSLEEDLTRVICRTERNWYVLDHRKGIDDTSAGTRAWPSRWELQEFFRLFSGLPTDVTRGQVIEFWKSSPSLLTFLDAGYALARELRDGRHRVPRSLLACGDEVASLVDRNHRVGRLVDLALGPRTESPPLWASPTYCYWRDEFFGPTPPRKVLVFSGWRFVPKAVAVLVSRAASDRFGGDPESPTQPLRFSEKRSFHVFDVCFPSPVLARAGQAFVHRGNRGTLTARDVVDAAAQALRAELTAAGVDVVERGGDPTWQVVFRLERHAGNASLVAPSLRRWATEDEDGAAGVIGEHADRALEWLGTSSARLELSESRLQHLALVAAFSPGCVVLRALQEVYGEDAAADAFDRTVSVCLGPMRRYFNRPHVQQIIRHHDFRLRWRAIDAATDHGYAERVLVYAADAHFQAVIDEYVYLLRYAGTCGSADEALDRLGEIWALARGNPRTNGAIGRGGRVQLTLEAHSQTAHFALAFGEDVAREAGEDDQPDRLRKSVMREAFNSPFWPFVLATTSVGQEGLDFHLYCRDVFHWNLPSNPVDLEQREGRINRRDCLAVRQSIARDWALSDVVTKPDGPPARSPWLNVFDGIDQSEDLQRYKHGLFPHWVYECRDQADTVRIQRHVPFFETSRDAVKYERLKSGLALYRLVFGQTNQEDLLDALQSQVESLDSSERARLLRRLAGYMLNLSPMGHEHAVRRALVEADAVLGDHGGATLEKLVQDVLQLQASRPEELGAVPEIQALVDAVRQSVATSTSLPMLRQAVAALTYLRNPYDRVFDLHVEGGFDDDIEEIKAAAAGLKKM